MDEEFWNFYSYKEKRIKNKAQCNYVNDYLLVIRLSTKNNYALQNNKKIGNDRIPVERVVIFDQTAIRLMIVKFFW